ncbi:MAG: alpha-amylase family protein [Ferruginibacter sp.]
MAYYRGPIPEEEFWDADFKKMQEMGFNSVKFLVQWRWSHIKENEFYFEDFKKLLVIAEKYGIGITLNNLFDVSPHWLFDKYPDARQVMNNGHTVQPYAVGHRNIGGHPGPCYNHPGAKNERVKFLTAAVKQLKNYPALHMWDIWNEPELSYSQRSPIDAERLVCYCPHCEKKFKTYLEKKYGLLSQLNNRWGRNYPDWAHVEMPRTSNTYLDFIDWREFHTHTITEEAAWRIRLVKELDPARPAFLHVVPNTMNPFNAITTSTDDFDVASLCDVFAATMNAGPLFTPQVVSAARGKICYNVEIHINGGSTGSHQKVLHLQDLLLNLVPQLGLGIKGFVFWQFRPEVLGAESPAWGLVNLDGSDREVTRATREFWKIIQSYVPALLESKPPVPSIGIWKSRKNEVFHYCMDNSLNNLIENVYGYANTLYWNSYAYRYISGDMLEKEEIGDLKVLIMPSAYYLTQPGADALAKWVKAGGVLIAEAHLGGYNGTTGRHSRKMPGCVLSEAFGIKEEVTTAAVHLPISDAMAFTINPDAHTKKAKESGAMKSGKHYPIRKTDGKDIWAAIRYAELSGNNITVEGYFEKDKPCAVSAAVEKGYVYYYATNLGSGAAVSNEGLLELIERACTRAGVQKTLRVSGSENSKLRTDILVRDSQVQFITLQNSASNQLSVSLSGEGTYKGLFTGMQLALKSDTKLELPPGFIDLFVRV